MRTIRMGEWKRLYEVWKVLHPEIQLKSDRARYVRGCKGKVLYESQQEAESIIPFIPKRDGAVLTTYPCSICGAIHIGNTYDKRLLNG